MPGAFEAAELEEAIAVVAVAEDDRVNLDAALGARAVNPNVRIVLSQFSRGLGRKLEENLPNCSVVSPAAHSAATFAAAALDPQCFYALEFPENSGRLAGFAAHKLRDLIPIAGISVATVESYVGTPIIACNGHAISDRGQLLQKDDEVVTFRPIVHAEEPRGWRRATGFLWKIIDPFASLFHEMDLMIRIIFLAGLVTFVAASIYFAYALRLKAITAAYFVVQTMTTVGYGDITLLDQPDTVKVIGILVMIGGVVISNLTVAFLSAALVRAQWIALQGLRNVHVSDHIVICGIGKVGTRVIEYLNGFGLPVVIVDRAPSATATRFGRQSGISLLTGDAVEDETLDLCGVDRARSVVVLTNNDAANLEIGLGVRARSGEIPLVMRINRTRFAERIRDQFHVRSIFSPVSLSTSAIVGLATSPSARGRIQIGDATFGIEERHKTEPAPQGAVVLARSGDRVLELTKLDAGR